MTYFSKLRFLLPIIAFLFSAVAGITFAAWLDAPNAPPNYGIVGCTPPCEQEDFMPMNLSATPQTKRGSIVVVGTIISALALVVAILFRRYGMGLAPQDG